MSNTDTIRDIWDQQAAEWHGQRDYLLTSSRPVHEWLVGAAAPGPGHVLLDVAAGPGDTGFLAASLLEPGGRLLCTDIAPKMLEIARLRAAEVGVTNAVFDLLDAQAMALDDDSIDAIVCRWALMLMPDPAAALRESRRVLRSGGSLAAMVFAGPQDNPWSAIPLRLLIAEGHLAAPAPGSPGLFALSDPDRLRQLVEDAGFDDVRVESVAMVWRFPDEDAYWRFLVELTALGQALRDVPDGARTALRAVVMEAVRPFWEDGELALPALCWGVVGRS